MGEIILCIVVGALMLLGISGFLYLASMSVLSECSTPEEIDKYFQELSQTLPYPSWNGTDFFWTGM